jgi:GMP synthase (glutamine-hydrolysing)
MKKELKFIIIDAYPKESREQFEHVGMCTAGKLYANMLLKYLPEAKYEIVFSSEPGVSLPGEAELAKYAGVLWPGCNLTVYHEQDERVSKILDMVKRAYKIGVPQFGSCWGAQIAVYAAGGKVAPNPKGREMGLARKIHLTDDGRNHPMYDGKAVVFDGYISHDDEITELPAGGKWLASNEFSRVQAVAVEHENGVFWATQYHPEYDLHELARLIVARSARLIHAGFFKDQQDMDRYVEQLETIHSEPGRKDLCWQLAIDEQVLDDSIRQREFINWLEKIVLPKAALKA